MMNYSLAAKVNPSEPESEKKFYACGQYLGTMDLQEFAKHIATHGCVYSRADIAAILTLAVDCLREQLLAGYKVFLGDLGAFYTTLTSTGTLTAAEFNPSDHITQVNVNWERGKLFNNLKEDAKFELVASRYAQAQVKKALKNGETTVSIVNTNNQESEEV